MQNESIGLEIYLLDKAGFFLYRGLSGGLSQHQREIKSAKMMRIENRNNSIIQIFSENV